MAHERLVAPAVLREFARDVFVHLDIPLSQAEDSADVLVWASLRGVDTHGIRNLYLVYVPMIERGRVCSDSQFTVEYDTPFSALVDGGCGLGMAAGVWAMRLAIEKASAAGIGMVAMRNSLHYGAAGYYAAMALSHDMIGVSLTGRFMPRGEEIGIVPTFAAVPMFSTNPIAIAVPTLDEPPYVLDMATSITPYNRVVLYGEQGRDIPPGWGMDAEGKPTTQTALLRQLLPLGGTRELGSHKGYGLAMVVEILSSVLSGSWQTGIADGSPTFDGYGQVADGHFFCAIRVDAFRPAQEFKHGMDTMIRALREAPKTPGQERIYVAGEIEHETERERSAQGIPIPPHVADALRELADRFGLRSCLNRS